MRTLTIIFTTAFVFLLVQQPTAAADGSDREKGGNSQVVVAGTSDFPFSSHLTEELITVGR
jgi:hypothetical protein